MRMTILGRDTARVSIDKDGVIRCTPLLNARTFLPVCGLMISHCPLSTARRGIDAKGVAAQAGVQLGDRITKVALGGLGEQTDAQSARRILSNAPGTITLTIVRAEEDGPASPKATIPPLGVTEAKGPGSRDGSPKTIINTQTFAC